MQRQSSQPEPDTLRVRARYESECTLTPLVQTILKVVVVFVAVLVLLEQVNIRTGPLLARLGLFGLAAGWPPNPSSGTSSTACSSRSRTAFRWATSPRCGVSAGVLRRLSYGDEYTAGSRRGYAQGPAVRLQHAGADRGMGTGPFWGFGSVCSGAAQNPPRQAMGGRAAISIAA